MCDEFKTNEVCRIGLDAVVYRRLLSAAHEALSLPKFNSGFQQRECLWQSSHCEWPRFVDGSETAANGQAVGRPRARAFVMMRD